MTKQPCFCDTNEMIRNQHLSLAVQSQSQQQELHSRLHTIALTGVTLGVGMVHNLARAMCVFYYQQQIASPQPPCSGHRLKLWLLLPLRSSSRLQVPLQILIACAMIQLHVSVATFSPQIPCSHKPLGTSAAVYSVQGGCLGASPKVSSLHRVRDAAQPLPGTGACAATRSSRPERWLLHAQGAPKRHLGHSLNRRREY